MRTIWPFRYVGLKLLSLGLGLLLWLVVSGEGTVDRGLRVPLELQQFPSDLWLESEPPANVDIRVRGSSGTLSRLALGDVVATLDLRGAQPGRQLFRLTPEQVRVPFGVEVVQVDPATVALAFARALSRQVPVVPVIEGKPAPGYVVGKISTDLGTVEAIGPENAVRRVTEALTEPVSVAGAQDTVRETVTVGLLDPLLRLKSPRPAVVTVEIAAAPASRVFHDVVVRLRNLAPGFSAEAAPVAVEIGLRGSREGLSRVDPGDMRVFVDLGGLGAGQYTLAPRAEIAGDVGVTSVNPQTVRVRISRAAN
jgi:hypothetical protein